MFELLIVDDEKFVVDSLSATYPWEDLQIGTVHVACSASEALELIGNRFIHIVITDIRMPGMNGLEMIDRIRELSPRTKCILLSGHSDFQYARQAISSQAEAYLLKPVKEAELVDTVRGAVRQIEAEWQEVASQQRTLYTLSEHLPQLRSALLNDLLLGKHIPLPVLTKKLDMLRLPLALGDRFALMFVRMDEYFARYDDYSRSLLEFGISNMAEEIFAQQFHLWHCKDVHDHLIFVVTERAAPVQAAAAPDEERMRSLLERCSLLLQDNVAAYLKGSVSVLISDWGAFPDDVHSFYQRSVSVIRSRPEHAEGLFVSSLNAQQTGDFQPLRNLQEPPLFLHLLEAGRWDAAERKLDAIIDELRTRSSGVSEHLKEISLMVGFSASHMLHKQGRSLSRYAELLDAGQEALRNADSLRRWARQVIDAVREASSREARGSQRSIIQKINEFVQTNLGRDVSLQTIADHVFLHPAYVSKLYKLDTGEGLSDYIYRLRMEKAAHLLRHTNEKIQDISRKTGYQNPSHFSRVFKKYFRLTPDEFREKEAARK